jgi:hypothetical protein
MAPSYRSIDYSLRPGKHAERKMISEALRRLHPFAAIDSYRYIGMGSLWFSDFIHLHRALGIRDMVSIEREAQHKKRFEFNKPLSSINFLFEDTATALPKSDWSVRSIFWLDYDDRLVRSMLEDIRVVASNATPGTVLMASVQVEGPPLYASQDDDGEEITREVTSIQELRDAYGPGAVPAEAQDTDLGGWALAKLVRQMVGLAIEAALGTRNVGRPDLQKMIFKQFCAFEYADGARMTTICGVFVDRGQNNLLASCGFDELPFYQPMNGATRLVVPVLTAREMKMLEAKLPDGPIDAIGGDVVPQRDAQAFAELYRYLPSFASLES